MFIACPACKSKFKAKPALLGKTIPCPKCGEEFEATAKRERVEKEGFNPVMISLVMLGFLVAGVVFMMNSGDDPAPIPPPKVVADDPPPRELPKPSTSPDSALIERAAKIVAAMRDEHDEDLPRWIDFAEAYGLEPGAADRPWSGLTDLDRFDYKERFVKRLCGEGEEREFHKAGVAKDLAVTSRGATTVELSGRIENPVAGQSRTMKMTLRPHDSAASWQLVAFSAGPIEIVGGKTLGRDTPVAEVDPAKLTVPKGPSLPEPAEVAPLAETTTLMSDAIRSALADIGNPESAVAGSRARAALVEAGKHAIPHVLNAMIPLDLSDPAQTLHASRLASTLIEITGIEYPIVPGGNVGSMLGEGAEDNDANRRRWFAWWRDHGKAFCEHGRAEPAPDDGDGDEDDGG